MCFVLVFGLLIQIKTIEESDSESLRTYTEDQLRTQVLEWKQKYEEAYTKLEGNEKLLEEYRTASTQKGESTKIMQKELEQANMMLGLKDVKRKWNYNYFR